MIDKQRKKQLNTVEKQGEQLKKTKKNASRKSWKKRKSGKIWIIKDNYKITCYVSLR